METREIIALILVSLVVIAVAVYALTTVHNNTQPTIVATLQPLKYDLEYLVKECNVEVISLIPPGVDPHQYNLDAKSASIVRKALVVVSSGHTSYELQLRNLGLDDKLIEIPRLEGIKYYEIPGDGVNPHMPIYDPDNYRIYISRVAEKLEAALPQCKEEIQSNLQVILEQLQSLDECRDHYKGALGVAGSPFTQYAVTWMGVNISVILQKGEGAAVDPQSIILAESLLKNGSIAIIAVDDKGEPVGEADSWLYQEALKYNNTIIKVPAPSIPGSTIEKLKSICNETHV